MVALDQVYQTGYGIVMPSVEELCLRNRNRSAGGAVWCTSAGFCTIHPYDAGQHQSEVNPIVGTGKAVGRNWYTICSASLRNSRRRFGRPIFSESRSIELVREELSLKLSRMPDDARGKIRETLEKIINESAGGPHLHHPCGIERACQNRHAFNRIVKTVRL